MKWILTKGRPGLRSQTNLAEIGEKLLRKRTAERLTDYRAAESDNTLSLVQKIIKPQEAINDVTRRKIHFLLLQGKLLEDCFRQSKEAYKKTLEQVKIERW